MRTNDHSGLQDALCSIASALSECEKEFDGCAEGSPLREPARRRCDALRVCAGILSSQIEAERFAAAEYVSALARQDPFRMLGFFQESAQVHLHNTGELMSARDYVDASCSIPGEWEGLLEQTQPCGGGVMFIATVSCAGKVNRVVSVASLSDGKITRLDEYWGECLKPAFSGSLIEEWIAGLFE